MISAFKSAVLPRLQVPAPPRKTAIIGLPGADIHVQLAADEWILEQAHDLLGGTFHVGDQDGLAPRAETFAIHAIVDDELRGRLGETTDLPWRVAGPNVRSLLLDEVVLIEKQEDGESSEHRAYFAMDVSSSTPKPLRLFVGSPCTPLTVARAARGLILLQLFRRGDRFLHASFAALEGRGIAVVGNKFAGKTTTLLNLLAGGFDFVSNDKVALPDGSVRAFGFPIAAGTRIGTLASFPDIAARLRNAVGPRGFTPTELASHDAQGARDDRKVRFRPRELSSAFGVRLTNDVQLAAILVPHFDPGCTWRSERADDREATTIMRDATLPEFVDIGAQDEFLDAFLPGRVPGAWASPSRDHPPAVPVWKVHHDAHNISKTVAFARSLLTATA